MNNSRSLLVKILKALGKVTHLRKCSVFAVFTMAIKYEPGVFYLLLDEHEYIRSGFHAFAKEKSCIALLQQGLGVCRGTGVCWDAIAAPKVLIHD